MVSVTERRKRTRPEEPAGSVSRHAQQRVDARVLEVMGAAMPPPRSDATRTQISRSRRGARPLLGRDLDERLGLGVLSELCRLSDALPFAREREP